MGSLTTGAQAIRLDRVDPQQVVRHAKNGSFYRVERPERGRIRIFSLELFPTGLLIPKSTPTIVAGDMEVVVIGPWCEDMVVEGKPRHTRRWYERELEKSRAELVELQVGYDELPVNGKGKLSRGSWANMIKAVEHRIATYERGLGFERTGAATAPAALPLVDGLAFHPEDLVQLPSGLPARVGSVTDSLVSVSTRFQGVSINAIVPPDVLRPWSQARVCTV